MSVRQEEIELLETLVVGDANAWRVFVERYQGLVYARVLRTAAETNTQLDRSDVEDICAEIFSGLIANDYASLRRFEGRSKLSTWLAVIARRVCLRRINAFRLPISHETPSEAVEPADSRQSTLGNLIAREDLERMHGCVQQLSTTDQQILKLYFEQNLSYQQIGRQLGVSENTVGPKLHRAQQRLKKLMTPLASSPTERSKDG